MRTKNLAERYDLESLAWEPIADRLARGYTQAPGSGGPDRHSTWLSTINPDGSPHVSGLGSVWLRDQFWFETGRTSRKGRNLERDPRCALSLALPEFDLTVNGRAELITQPELVAELAA